MKGNALSQEKIIIMKKRKYIKKIKFKIFLSSVFLGERYGPWATDQNCFFSYMHVELSYN